MASLRFLLSQNARIASSLSHCEIKYPASGSFSSRSSHCPFSPFTSPRISSARLNAASKASHWPGRILPQMIRICIAIPPLGTRQDTSQVITRHCPDRPVTADRRLVGTGIAAVSEEGSGILSGDAVECGSECLFQSLDGACGDPPQIGLHLGPARFDRAEIGAVAGQVAIGKA